MKTFSSFCVFMLLLILASCRGTGTNCITISNKSEKTIGLQIHYSSDIKEEAPIYQEYITVHVLPKDSVFWMISRNSWEDKFKFIPFIRLLILDNVAYECYSKCEVDTIRKYVPIYHCFDLTLEDLQAMNWTVVYPPKETE